MTDCPPSARTGGYHHGALRAALIAAGEQILAEKGLEGFTLREAARRASVSPAAPSYHFGDVTGLLTALACLGFEDLTRRLVTARDVAATGFDTRLRAQCAAYLAFAMERPGLYGLMFRCDKIDLTNPALASASGTALAELTGTVGTLPAHLVNVALIWSLLHGFCNLVLQGHIAYLAGDSAMEQKAPALLADLLSRLNLTPPGL